MQAFAWVCSGSEGGQFSCQVGGWLASQATACRWVAGQASQATGSVDEYGRFVRVP